MSFFTGIGEASRYARSRPYFHPLVIARAKEVLGIQGRVPVALDVACGTGQSTIALASIAEKVIGFDISPNMLANLVRNDQVEYAQARAEQLPFLDGSVALTTCALAFHWFDRDRVLGEVWRVLDTLGKFLVYNNGFTGIMREDPSFQDWAQKEYPKRFPVPPRNSQPITREEATSKGFTLIKEERFENEIRFNAKELVAYLTTQTNVVAAVREGRVSLQSADKWLLEQVTPYFSAEKATFVFVTRAWFLTKEV